MGAFADTIKRFFGFTESTTGSGFATSVHLNDPSLASMLSLNSGKVTVSEETAISLPMVYRCIDTISSSFASLPWALMQRSGTVNTPADAHPNQFLTVRPHPLQTSFVWRKTIMAHALLEGNGFARIVRNGVYRPVEYKLYHPREVIVTTDLWRNTVAYRFPDVAEALGPESVIHLKLFSTDGIIGRSPIRLAPELFKVPLQSRRFIAALLENGARPAAIITSKKIISPTGKANIKQGWNADHGGESNAGKMTVLDEDMGYQSVAINPVDAQILELMQLSDEQICTMFGFPQHMAGILRQSTNNNIEHQGLEYIANCIRPHVINFQEEIDYKTLRAQELGRYFNSLDLNSLQLQDITAKKELYQFFVTNGIMSPNAVLDKFGENPVAGGDMRYMQGAMVAVNQTDGTLLYPPKSATATEPKPTNGHKLPVN